MYDKLYIVLQFAQHIREENIKLSIKFQIYLLFIILGDEFIINKTLINQGFNVRAFNKKKKKKCS